MGILHIGTSPNGKPFTLPADLGDRKIAVLAMSKAGKTYGLGDILEELYYAQRPWAVLDPANNFWGLRVKPDGTPSDIECVVIGGPHGDLPLEKGSGERVAEAFLSESICVVIDIAFESAGTVRRFSTDFANRLMRQRCVPERVIVLEECPVLVPQKAFGPQMQECKNAVGKLLTIGGNYGYGVIPASQRSATIDKDILTQCEALIVMRMTGSTDRAAVKDWMKAKDLGDKLEGLFNTLGSLEDGEAYLWWPVENRFEKFTFRKRHTLHPREMKRLKLQQHDIKLGDATRFVEQLRSQLTKTSVAVPEGPIKKGRTPRDLDPTKISLARVGEFDRIMKENEDLRSKLEDVSQKFSQARQESADASRRLAAVREACRPQYDALRSLYDHLTPASGGGRTAVDRKPFEKWFEKASKTGIKIMLEYLIEKGEATRQQLATLAGVTTRTGYDYINWMRRNNLVDSNGQKIVIREI